jgi:hypothetical protein
MSSERKNNLRSIVLGVSLFLNVLFLGFAFVQKAAANSARLEASQNEQRAIRNEIEAQAQQRRAAEAQMMARTALRECTVQLEAEKSKVKSK